jgi:murein DD-endopeptidase MepM/ murein hydrolase activator NlpD
VEPVGRTVRLGGGIAVALVGLLVVTLLALTLPAVAAPTTPPTASSSGPSAADRSSDDPTGQQDEDIHADPALVAASARLVAAETDLAAARVALATVRDELAAARQAEHQARVELHAAQLAEASAARELAAVRDRITVHRTNLGRLANAAYQGNGRLGSWSLILASQTPEQLVDRLAYVQSVSNAGNSMIAGLQEDRANLSNLLARLAAARMLRDRERAAAAAAVQRIAAKEQQAVLAEAQLQATVLAYRAALDAARLAKADDQARYQALATQSGALAERIRSMSARLALLPRPPKGTGSFIRPGTGPVTSPFGPRLHPILHYVKVHTGMDFGSGDGLVYAADSGVVLMTELNTAYGNMTVIDHGTVAGQRLATLYAHQAAFAVHPGDRVRKGQPIGVVGSTGFATGPHIHFEVRVDGVPLDPAPFLEHAQPPGTALR